MLRLPKRLLGRRELLDFPAFGLHGIEAKVDTGAYTSALHCADVRLEIRPGAGPLLHARLLDPDHAGFDGRPLTFQEFQLRDIRSSNGEVQERYVIRAVVRLYGEDFEAEFSLADRSDMKYPVLLGRSLLRQGRFMVDVARRNLSRRFEVKARRAR
ncbi:ATP-dependent zinc protease [uncultured Hymenobacter sp.]|uniref:ATP-dependent zinc protease family protein n=1 Tax=uncultured Hymenobacter sp. TaxID=170016 RepID=UPI0035CCA6CC